MPKKVSHKDDYLDINKLIEDYSPLMKSIYKKFSKFNNLYYSHSDYEDLEAQIQYEFVKLCNEYNPARGVDFPGFIKFHLQQRVYHFVTKMQRTRQKETVAYGREYDGEFDESIDFDNVPEAVDEDSIKSFERVEALACLDWSVIQNQKQRQLVEDVLYNKKSLEEIAANEGVPLKVIRLRLYAVCNLLIEHANNLDEEYKKRYAAPKQENQMDSLKDAVNNFNIVRKPIITRTPIFLEVNKDETRKHIQRF